MAGDGIWRLFREKLAPRQFLDGQFIRFVVVGFSNFIIGFSIFWLCIHAPLEFPLKASVSQLMSYAISTFWSFYWNRRLTFKSSGSVLKQASRFISLQVSFALSSAALIGFGVDVLNASPILSWFVVMGAVTVANFLLSKWWAFK